MKQKKLRVLYVCNRGGHFSKMLALRELFPLYDSMLVTQDSAALRNLDLGIPIKVISNDYLFYNKILFLLTNFWKDFFICLSFRPNVIITTGSRMAVPMFYVGKLFRAKLIFIETNARVYSKSVSGKIMEKLCDLIVVQWKEMLTVYPKAVYWGQLI